MLKLGLHVNSTRSYQRKELHAIEGSEIPEVNMTEGELNSVETHSTDFMIDSGATHHCVNNINHLINYQPFSKCVEVKVAGNQPTRAVSKGSTDFLPKSRVSAPC